MEQQKHIELRSEKVRNIIGQVPPVLLRYGIMIIGLSLLMLVGVSAFIPYQPSFETEITVEQDRNGILQFSAIIPQKAMTNRTKVTEVILNSSTELPLPTHFRIRSISDTTQLSAKNAWHTALLLPIDETPNSIVLRSPIIVPAKIMLEKQSVMRWVVGKVRE